VKSPITPVFPDLAVVEFTKQIGVTAPIQASLVVGC